MGRRGHGELATLGGGDCTGRICGNWECWRKTGSGVGDWEYQGRLGLRELEALEELVALEGLATLG